MPQNKKNENLAITLASECSQIINGVKEKARSWEERYEDLRTHTDQAYRDLRAGLELAFEDLSMACQSAKERFDEQTRGDFHENN